MLLIGLCTAAVAGIAIADLRSLSVPQLLLTTVLAALAACVASPHRLPRTLALLACAASLGAARASFTAELPALRQLGAATNALTATLAPMRTAARANISAYLPQPQAALAAGILLGGSTDLDPAFKADLQRSGLAHMVAIEGFKLVIVAAGVSALAARTLGPRLALVPCLLTVASYTLLTGAHPSAVRAALMVSLARLAGLSGRIADPLTSLALALLGMALIEPRILLDMGLQLSVSATLGIVLLWPTLRRRLRLYRLPRALAEPIGLSLAVGLACLPLTLGAFGLVSLASPLAHVVAVPLLPAQLLGTALLALAASLAQAPPPAWLPSLAAWLPSSLATASAWLAWLPASLLVAVVRGFGSLPGAAVSTGRLSPLAAVALAAALLGWGLWQLPELREARLAWRGWQRQHQAAFQPITCAAAALLLAASLKALMPDGRLHVEPLGLQRGEAVFVRGPTGTTAVVVLGPLRPAELASQAAGHMAVWEHHLDAVVALDPRAQAALGPLLSQYPPSQLIAAPGVTLEIGENQRLAFAVHAGHISVDSAQAEARSVRTTSAARPESAD
jgi:ComEC/Rec2-related protein